MVDELKLVEPIKKLINLFLQLEKARIEYNKPFENLDELKVDLNKLNDEMAYYEIIDLYNIYQIQDKQYKDQQNLIMEIKNQINSQELKIKDLNAKKKSIDIAVNFINSSLRYVFFSQNRLKIEVKKDKYTLKSNGLPVHPKDVSQGEKNIIALCYFFTEILNKKDEKNAYKDEMFLVIDDPISSFDRDNRIGIMSFLKEKINVIARANKNTKIVILSHDIQTIYDFEKIGQEVQKSATNQYKNKIWTYRILELCRQNLIDFKYKKRHEYTEMLKEIYDFAVNGNEKYLLTIGNTMRRVLESFSTFNFKKGIDEISYDQTILGMLNDECYKKYFENLMYRLILNGESHMEERAKGEDTDFCEMYSKEEKQRTARDILVFLYLISSVHVEAHLHDIKDSVTEIKKWSNEIKEMDL